jgi:DNA-binding IclR family transcriptional regulator
MADTTPDNVVPRDYSIDAIDRALDLMEALARLGPSSSASLADAVGCPRPTAFRILRTLQKRGFALQDGARGVWRLGPRNAALARAASEHGALAAVAQPVLLSLSQLSGENAYLMVREGSASLVIAKSEIRPWLNEEIGRYRQLHAGPGRLLLAHAPVAAQLRALAEQLTRLTPKTRVDPIWIAADMHRIRSREYLLTSDEVAEGDIAVAAAVHDQRAEVIAVLFIATSTVRLTTARAQTLAAIVVAHAATLSAILGYPTPE